MPPQPSGVPHALTTTGQGVRADHRFALVAYGGELATQWGLTGWPTGTAQEAAARLFREWLADRGGAGDTELRAGLAAVRAFIEAHGESRVTPWQNPPTHSIRTLNRVGFRREMEDGPYFYVLPNALSCARASMPTR